MERHAYSINFWATPTRKRNDGTIPIHATITLNGIRASFSTGRKALLADWDNIKQRVKGTSLHLIDFETSAVAIPFNAGRRPYEQIAFQFSHHILFQDGRINHVSQYISNEPGVFPNFVFVRHLKQDLEKDNGSIFRYATHENTILNAISKQLLESNEPDKAELFEIYISKSFILFHSFSVNGANLVQIEILSENK